MLNLNGHFNKLYILSTLIGNFFSFKGNPTAVGFSSENLIIGTNTGSVLLWDQIKHKLIRKYAAVSPQQITDDYFQSFHLFQKNVIC